MCKVRAQWVKAPWRMVRCLALNTLIIGGELSSLWVTYTESMEKRKGGDGVKNPSHLRKRGQLRCAELRCLLYCMHASSTGPYKVVSQSQRLFMVETGSF